MNRQPQRRMNVFSVNSDGKKIDMGTWSPISAPNKLDSNGFNQVGTYMARMITSGAARCCLFIAAPDGKTTCVIMGEAGQLKISVEIHLEPSSREVQESFKQRNLPPHIAEPEKEQAVRELFEELNIAPDRDTVHDCNGYIDAIRNIDYPIGNDIDQAVHIIQRFLSTVNHVQETDELDFTCYEFYEPELLQ